MSPRENQNLLPARLNFFTVGLWPQLIYAAQQATVNSSWRLGAGGVGSILSDWRFFATASHHIRRTEIAWAIDVLKPLMSWFGPNRYGPTPQRNSPFVGRTRSSASRFLLCRLKYPFWACKINTPLSDEATMVRAGTMQTVQIEYHFFIIFFAFPQ